MSSGGRGEQEQEQVRARSGELWRPTVHGAACGLLPPAAAVACCLLADTGMASSSSKSCTPRRSASSPRRPTAWPPAEKRRCPTSRRREAEGEGEGGSCPRWSVPRGRQQRARMVTGDSAQGAVGVAAMQAGGLARRESKLKMRAEKGEDTPRENEKETRQTERKSRYRTHVNTTT